MTVEKTCLHLRATQINLMTEALCGADGDSMEALTTLAGNYAALIVAVSEKGLQGEVEEFTAEFKAATTEVL